jgi:quercetin dioxygenase-like cupin family protein
VPDVTVIAPAGGEVIGDSPDRRVEILADHDSLNATWSRFGPGRDGADLHVHREHTDLFYVLEGEFTLRLGPAGEPRPLGAGTLAWVPPGVVHGFRNASGAELRFLNFHAPGVGFAAYMRDLRDGRPAAYDQWDPPEDGGRPISEVEFGERVDIPAIKIFPAAIEPGAAESHEDARHTELYVLEGELLVSGERAKAGAWAHVAPGEPHTLEGAARFLVVHTPA